LYYSLLMNCGGFSLVGFLPEGNCSSTFEHAPAHTPRCSSGTFLLNGQVMFELHIFILLYPWVSDLPRSTLLLMVVLNESFLLLRYNASWGRPRTHTHAYLSDQMYPPSHAQRNTDIYINRAINLNARFLLSTPPRDFA